MVCGSRQVSTYEMWRRKQIKIDARRMHRTKILVKKLEKWERRHLGGHDLVRRMDRQGEVMIWCRKCSGYARQRMGPKLMNCCKPEPMGIQEYGKMLKGIQVLEDGRVLAKEAGSWRVEGQKRRMTRKEYQRPLNKFEMEGFMVQQGLWNLAREETLGDRGALPTEEGHVIREYRAMHEEQGKKRKTKKGAKRGEKKRRKNRTKRKC